MTQRLPSFLLLVLLAVFSSCERQPQTLFKLRSSAETGIDFVNTVAENDTFNILTVEYIYNGGGVGIADFNNDGLQDIFFTGNTVPNRLYINSGGLKFQDVTQQASVNVEGRWNSGVSVVDINDDGWMDVYITATMYANPADRRNMLFVNKGTNEAGVPAFEEQAAAYGIDDDGYSVMAAFFDYDLDSDLDLYVLTNARMDHLPTSYRPKITDGSAINNDRLYRNEGNGKFVNVTVPAGITYEGFGLGLAVSDLNKDGWPDLYVSNDYVSNDVLYVNNKDGTFTNRIGDYIAHQSQFSMGNDVADVNNDTHPDIVTTDMLPETNARKKTTIGNKSYLVYQLNEQYKYEYQYIRNMLHINNGMDEGRKFSEIGQLAGVYQTEWSWSPLFIDMDNDGLKDLIVTNGFPKDVTDKDFSNYRADLGAIAPPSMLNDSIPVVKIPNYAFRNLDGYKFEDATNAWGLGLKSFSNGAAFADLDNDGDNDYIVNNINDAAFVFENTLNSTPNPNHFVQVALQGAPGNRNALGAKVTVYSQGVTQYVEHYPYRGFLSSTGNLLHFGVGSATVADSIVVEWPGGGKSIATAVSTDTSVALSSASAVITPRQPRPRTILQRIASPMYRHAEEDYIDFSVQRTLPHKFSQSGPALAAGDVNGDGREDLVVGGSVGHRPTVLIATGDGKFNSPRQTDVVTEKTSEDAGLLLFDADNDGDLDLFVAAGGFEGTDSVIYKHQLLLNDGRGNFKPADAAVEPIYGSGSCVRAADFDSDGDLDLFVGGRVIPGSYPLPPRSYLLVNDKGRFTDGTAAVCPDLMQIGMVSDAVWSDFNGDNKVDLVVAGEFMPIRFFSNKDGKLEEQKESGVGNISGWWNSLAAADFDNDGDPDYIAGNLGNNNGYQVTRSFPLHIYAKDLDGNGSVDPVLACYMRVSMDDSVKMLYPVHFWDELNQQSPKFRRMFSRYRQFGNATLDKLLSEKDREGALVMTANEMGSGYFENKGNGKFEMRPLPVQAQLAPVLGMVVADINSDGAPDVIMV